MPRKKTRDPETTRAALLQAAEDLFLKKGFGSTSLSEIAARAGITKSLIHHYFRSKEGLWREVKVQRLMLYAERQLNMLQDAEPGADLLRASLGLYFDFLRRHPQNVRILAWMSLEQHQSVCMDFDRELIATGVAKIRAGQAAGKLAKDIDPRYIMFVFMGLCQHWFQYKMHFELNFGTDDLTGDLDEAYLNAAIKLFFEGLLPR